MLPASHVDLRLCGLEAEEFAVVSPPLFSIPFWQLLFLGQIAPCLPACLRHGNREKGKNGQDYISIHVSKFDLHRISCNFKWLLLGKVGKGGRKPRARFLRWNREFHWGESTLLWSNLPITPWVIFLPIRFSCSVVSHSLPPHGLQHARPPCPSPTLEFTQTHVHWVGDAIQPSHPLSSPSPPAFSLQSMRSQRVGHDWATELNWKVKKKSE